MTAIEVIFYILAAVAVISAAGVVSARNPIYSALFLVVTLFALAVLFVLLKAEFLAIIQILTYAGAILVLFVFIIMLLNLKPDELIERGYGNAMKFLIGIASFSLFLILGYVFHFAKWQAPAINPGFGDAASVGKEIFTRYVVPFELAGVLLTVALVGAVVLAKRKLD